MKACGVISGLFCAAVAAMLVFGAPQAGAQENPPLTAEQKAAFLKAGTDTDTQVWRKKIYIPYQTSPEDLTLVAVGTITEITKPDLIKLDDGNTYGLLNIRVPLIYLPKAQDYMTKTFVGKKIGIYQRKFKNVSTNDRLGNISGNALTEDNVWIEADLILNGLAWADSTPENRDLVQKLYQYETIARDKRAGFWASAEFAVKNAKTMLTNTNNSFQVFEDVIKNVKPYAGGTLIYFSFGDDATKDFTIVMPRKIAAYFRGLRDPSFNPARWPGRRVRVRGWVEENSGPMIEITHPEQMEVIGAEGQFNPLLPPEKEDKAQ